jgi:hypothetical protein
MLVGVQVGNSLPIPERLAGTFVAAQTPAEGPDILKVENSFSDSRIEVEFSVYIGCARLRA